MGEVNYDTIEGWAKGVNTSLRPDLIGNEASPRAWNNEFQNVGMPGQPVIACKRDGMRTINTSPVTGTPAIVAQAEYNYVSGNSNTRYHLIVGDNGYLAKVNSDNTVSAADATATTPFTATTGQNFITYQEAANLAFFANGVDLKKFNGANGKVQNFGITRPAVVPTIADSGVAGNHNGTYEARYTYYNSATGVESSASDSSTQLTVANKKINWTWTVSGDAQVDKVRLYLRNTGTMANFFQVTEIAVGTGQPFQTNVLDSNLTLVAPNTNQNNPPSTGIKRLAWHRSRLFAADDNQLYFSQLGVPEQFDPNNFERVNPQDGQRIVGIVSVNEVLVILKRNSMHILSGDDPNSWSLPVVDPSIGCVAPRSIVVVEGVVYWWSDIGPVRWMGFGMPQPIGLPYIASTLDHDNINEAQTINIAGAVDLIHQRVIWAVPAAGSTRNTFMLPWNYRLQAWESDRWNPMDVGSLGTVRDSNDVPWVYLGNYAGQVLRMGDHTSDGMRDTNNANVVLTKSGTVTTTAGQTTFGTVTPDGSVTLDTDGVGLIERYAIIEDSNGLIVGRSRITSNNATTFTLADTITGLTPSTAYRWSIGSPDWQFDTAWMTTGQPFFKKRYTYLMLQFAGSSSTTYRVDIFRNFDPSLVSYRTVTPNLVGGLGTSFWDSALWDVGGFEVTTPGSLRIRVGATGRAWQARIRNRTPDAVTCLTKVSMESEMLTSRS